MTKNSLIPMLLSVVTCTSMMNLPLLASEKELSKKEMIQMIDASFTQDLNDLKYVSKKKGTFIFENDKFQVEVSQNKDTYDMSLYSNMVNDGLENAGVAHTPISQSVYTVEEVKKESKEVQIEEDFYQKIADAAMSQIGVYQDCTMLVTNSLAAVGIHFHGAPYEYEALGEWTNTPVPGDICMYYGHVAIYVGNGMAVHGGWNGYCTILTTVECSNGLIGYIHVSK